MSLISPEIIAHDYRNLFTAALPGVLLEENIKALEAGTIREGAKGSITSLVLWTEVACKVTNGENFLGKCWGIGFPGGGTLIGDIYSDDFTRMYRDTTTVAVNCFPTYTAFYFYDNYHAALGHLQAGPISTVAAGGFGGSGSWSW